MLQLPRKIFIAEILHLTFTFYWRKIKSVFIRSKNVQSRQTWNDQYALERVCTNRIMNRNGIRNRKVFLERKRKVIEYRKQSTTAKWKNKFIQTNFKQCSAIFFVRSKNNFVDKKANIFKDTKDIILSSSWM